MLSSYIFPNPSSGQGIIQFSTDSPGNIEIKIYTLAGIVQSVVDYGWYASGSYEIPFSQNNLAQGMYLYSIFLNNKFLGSGKLVVVE